MRSFDVMGALTREVRHFAEEPNAEVSEPLPPEARVRTPSFILDMGGSPTLSSVSRVRTTVRHPEDGVAGWMAAAPALWKQQDGVHRMTLVARVDGRVVGFGFAAGGPRGLLLCGSGVLADARGRGAYRALVAARWKIAVDLGTPALVIHAESMSRPIVERCGFERICRVDVLVDPEIR